MITSKFILVFTLTFALAVTKIATDDNSASPRSESRTGYNPDVENVHHLFTRQNPYVSQPILFGNENQLKSSNFNPGRRTIYLIHGWVDSITALFNKVLVPAFLEAADVNVIAVDWGIGAWSFGEEAFTNTVLSGQSGARFINWLNSMTGASPENYHLVGYSLGAQQAAIIARAVDGTIGYVSALDPAGALLNTTHFFTPDCANYTEAIHTSAEGRGYGRPIAQADFYPNGGTQMPRCDDDDDLLCQHESCFFYMAESLSTEFIGEECATYEDARARNCNLPGRLKMGGLWPKPGSTGLYYVNVNGATAISSSFIIFFIISLNCLKHLCYEIL